MRATVLAFAVGLGCVALLIVAAGSLLWMRRPSELDVRERVLAGLVGGATLAVAAMLGLLFAGVALGVGGLAYASLAFAFVAAIAGSVSFHHASSHAPMVQTQPSRRDLQDRLRNERRVIDDLKTHSGQLLAQIEDTTREVAEVKRRFEVALRGSPISVFSQDENLRYLWMHNPPAGLFEADLIGRSDDELWPAAIARTLVAFKRGVIAGRVSDRLELEVPGHPLTRWFDIVAEPYPIEGRRVGVLCVAVEITQRKRREDQLRAALREMSHRSKNLLAILLGVARQTAQGSDSVETFMSAFSARMLSMSITQDLLVDAGWTAVGLAQLIRAQAQSYLDDGGSCLDAKGPPASLKPEPAQNLGLALHELIRSSTRTGGLGPGGGRVQVRWRYAAAERDPILTLEWVEVGGAFAARPPDDEFGRMMLMSMLPRALDGTCSVTIEPRGFRLVLTMSARHLVPVHTDGSSTGAE